MAIDVAPQGDLVLCTEIEEQVREEEQVPGDSAFSVDEVSLRGVVRLDNEVCRRREDYAVRPAAKLDEKAHGQGVPSRRIAVYVDANGEGLLVVLA